MRPRGSVLVLGALLLASAPLARAQDPDPQPPAHVEIVDGDAEVVRDGQAQPAVSSLPLLDGDRLRTDAGRVEVLLGDGTALYVDQHATIDLLSGSLMRLMEGRLRVVVIGTQAASTQPRYQVDTPAASVRIDAPGEYRVATFTGASAPEAELAVVRGTAQFATDVGAIVVRAGERSVARENQTPGFPQVFNSARLDAFDRWADERQEARTGTISSQYLPPEVQMYAGSFDRYGSWGQLPDYGYVWYPTSAGSNWRPYYNGYWNLVGPYGWTWIGLDRWAWPTHHFGRWGQHRGAWFWIPSRRWGAAWVSWAVSPGFVSWCPLGFDGRPAVGFWDHSFNTGSFHDPWSGWTVLPRRSFGLSTHISASAVDGRTLASDSRTAFIVQNRPPFVRPSTRGGASRVITGIPDRAALPRSALQPASAPRRTSDGGADPRVGPGQRWAETGGTASPRVIEGSRSGIEQAVLSGRRGQGPRVDTRPGSSIAVPRRQIGGMVAPFPSRSIPPTHIDSPTGPLYPGIPNAYSAGRDSESPYDRAARVAAQRAPGGARQTFGGAGPAGIGSPREYHSSGVSQPYGALPAGSSPFGANANGVYGRRPAIPRGGGMIVNAPPGSSPLPYPAPYAPTIVMPRAPAGPPPAPPPAPQRPPAPRGKPR